MNFRLKIYDNYHYMDESEAYWSGDFETAEAAESEARHIIEKSIEGLLSNGTELHEVYESFMLFGDDPMIISINPNFEAPLFSSSSYAKQYIAKLIEKERINRLYLE